MSMRHEHEASLEVLTDGSDLTEPAIFLTIRRYNNHHRQRQRQRQRMQSSQPIISGSSASTFYQHEPSTSKDAVNVEEEEGVIVARYNISGLPSLTGRLSSDQSFKLLQGGAFRAVLIPSLVSSSFHDGDGECGSGSSMKMKEVIKGASLCGLPALFLNLIQSGYKIAQAQSSVMPVVMNNNNDHNGSDSAPEIDDIKTAKDMSRTVSGYGDVSIIGPPGVGAKVDGILDTMFAKFRKRPSIRICEVPDAASSCNWWEVYEDSYVKIWAQLVVVSTIPTTTTTTTESCISYLCEHCCSAAKKMHGNENADEIVLSSTSSSSSSPSSSGNDDDDDDNSGDGESDSGDDESSDSSDTRDASNDGPGPTSSSSPNSGTGSGHSSVVYIVMMLPQNNKEEGKHRGRGRTSTTANQNHCHGQPSSFAIMPAAPSSSSSTCKCHKCGVICNNNRQQQQSKNPAPFLNTLKNLPQEIISNHQGGGRSSMLDFILHLDPLVDTGVHDDSDEECSNNGTCIQSKEPLIKRRRIEQTEEFDASARKREVPQRKIVLPSWVIDSKIANHHLATFPNNNSHHNIIDNQNGENDVVHDEGILVRAQHRSKLFQKALPFAFPLSSNSFEGHYLNQHPKQQQQHEQATNRGQKNTCKVKTSGLSSVSAFGLSSCTSVTIGGFKKMLSNGSDTVDGIDNGCEGQQPFAFLSRIEGISKRCKANSFSSWTTIARADSTSSATHDVVDYASTVQSLKCAFRGGLCFCNECKDVPLDVGSGCNIMDDNEISLGDSDDANSETQGDGTSKEFPAEDSTPMSEISCNEIMDVTSPHLIILGTGCATPSPLRGSSAYGLLLPTSVNGSAALVLSAIIECGEGTLTGLFRHLSSLSDGNNGPVDSHLTGLDAQLSNVAFIWISHSHLDHYGDLPILVQAIANAKQKLSHDTRQRTNPLLVIAPSKVIRYLNVLLHQTNALRTNGNGDSQRQFYVCVTHRDFQHSPFAGHLRSFVYDYALPVPTTGDVKQKQNAAMDTNNHYLPFASLRNVEVEHCREAFALILQMNIPEVRNRLVGMRSSNLADFTLCFSGDTRPSDKLVRGCLSYSSPQSNMQAWQQNNHYRQNVPLSPPTAVSLLIHEATFLNDTQGLLDAAKKRHSTTVEALDIAQRINAEACILTHFSQRYQHVSIKDISSTNNNAYPFSWGVALDGMVIPLTKRALSRLFDLSLCMDALASMGSDGE